MATTERIQVWIEGDRTFRNSLKSAAAELDTSQECLLRLAADNLLAKDVQLIKQMLVQANCSTKETSDAATKGSQS